MHYMYLNYTSCQKDHLLSQKVFPISYDNVQMHSRLLLVHNRNALCDHMFCVCNVIWSSEFFQVFFLDRVECLFSLTNAAATF